MQHYHGDDMHRSAKWLLLGVLWIGPLLRYQNSIITLSDTMPGEKGLSEFFTILHKWYFWGAVATVLPLISLVLMFLKPRV